MSVAPRRARARKAKSKLPSAHFLGLLALLAAAAGLTAVFLQSRYTFSLQSPLRLHFQWPLVIAPRSSAKEPGAPRHLTAYQQYACNKFGADCRIALAVQRAENPRGACEIYHYNSDGTLDWGFFQINTVRLKRAGVNLRDLLDCKANIDFAYILYTERGFAPWTTFNSGAYRQYLNAF